MRDMSHFRSALAGGLLAAIVMTAMPALAGVGDAIILGVKNLGSAETELQGSESGPLLRLDNNHSNGVGARFEVKPGNPPFTVSSGSKVGKLNADKLDGKSAGGFLTKNGYDDNRDGIVDLSPRAAFKHVDNPPDGGGYTLSVNITAPAPGIILISGGIDTANYTTPGSSSYACWLEIDDVQVAGTVMVGTSGGGPSVNPEEDCTTTGAKTVGEGAHSVTFVLDNSYATTTLDDVSVWALWVPLNGSGNVPNVP